MIDLERLNKNKEGILSALRLRGPSLPVRIANTVGLPPLFTAAFLSELKAEQKLKVSNMKVGSSPLYYLEGQEEKLINFVEHLSQREREAVELLKKEKVLLDSEQTPVIRVALRATKDFAVPVKIRIDGELKLFWKYFLLKDDEIGEFIKKRVDDEKTLPEKKEEAKEIKEEVLKVGEIKEEIKEEELLEKKKPDVKKVKKEHFNKKKEEYEFGRNVKDYLAGKDIEVLEILLDKSKEFIAKVRVDGMFGKQSYYLVSKDKKTVTDNDLTVVLQRAQAEKMAGLVMCGGELNKKAKDYLKEWGNLVKFEKLNF